jgi:endoglucanase
MKILCHYFFLIVLLMLVQTPESRSQVFIRLNQVGYLMDESKKAVVFTNQRIPGKFSIVNAETLETAYRGRLASIEEVGWGNFDYYYLADFSELTTPGIYQVKINTKSDTSYHFMIGKNSYNGYSEDILNFMRQQRCGYNPFFDELCHQWDGRTAYGQLPDSTYVDASGGWHDAGDQLKYLITSSFATGFMLLAYELESGKFDDLTDDLGRPGSNGLADVLDEAKWGLDWIHKLYAYPEILIHQVADDRDHQGWKWPFRDPSDYGWGANSYRVAYVATGEPQGLGKYKSQATGFANVAGRSAAALALGYRVFKDMDSIYADACLRKAIDLYAYSKKNEGYQQGNSFGAPYRYNEETWADDMEWAAAELFKATGKESYLEDGIHYAKMIGVTSWMELDSAAHYQFYPFINVGHFSLYPSVDEEFKKVLAGYYASGIENCKVRADKNPFGIGIPFIWCSNNLVTALVSQIILYEIMTGDHSYHELMLSHRDWLFGKNPWGTSMFMNIPRYGEYPEEVHTSTWALTKKEVPGGLVDGPVFTSIYNNLSGLELTQPDEFKVFQNDHVVYHDDIGDYSTNEPTMDGTAGAILLIATFSDDIE